MRERHLWAFEIRFEISPPPFPTAFPKACAPWNTGQPCSPPSGCACPDLPAPLDTVCRHAPAGLPRGGRSKRRGPGMAAGGERSGTASSQCLLEFLSAPLYEVMPSRAFIACN